jgi:hypothetical protein
MGKRKLERTNKRRQAQSETVEQGNRTKHKGCSPESCDVITTPAAAWALDRDVQTHWVNERAVRLYSTTGVTRAAFYVSLQSDENNERSVYTTTRLLRNYLHSAF